MGLRIFIEIQNFVLKVKFQNTNCRYFQIFAQIVAKNRDAFKKWSLGSNRVRELWNSVTRDVEHAEEAENDTSYFDI